MTRFCTGVGLQYLRGFLSASLAKRMRRAVIFVSWRELYVSLPNSYEPESIGELPRGILLHPRALKEIAPSCTQEEDDSGWFWWGLGVAFKWYWDSFKLLPLSLPIVGGLIL